MRITNELKLKPDLFSEQPGVTAYRLTGRETDILRLLVKGLSNQQMADDLGMKFYTVTTHLKSIYKKFGIHKRAGVVAKVLTEGLLADSRLPVPRLSGREPLIAVRLSGWQLTEMQTGFAGENRKLKKLNS